MDVKDETASKIKKAMRMGKGVRMCCDAEEANSMEGEDMEFTEGGRVKVKSLKQLNRESARNLKKAGKELKKVGKDITEGYKSKVRKYTSPFFKGAIEYALPTIASDLVGALADTFEAPPIVKKTLQAGTKSAIKPLATKAYKKSGLGVKMSKMPMSKVAVERRIPRMPVKTLPRSIAVNDMDMGMGLFAGKMGMGMCINDGGALRYKNLFIGDKKFPPIMMGGAVPNTDFFIDNSSGIYDPFQNASTPMMPIRGKGLF
jgi:hypothetical protein